jgi:hypothetical protein
MAVKLIILFNDLPMWYTIIYIKNKNKVDTFRLGVYRNLEQAFGFRPLV